MYHWWHSNNKTITENDRKHLKRTKEIQITIILALNKNTFNSSTASDSKRVAILKCSGPESDEVDQYL